MQKELEKYSKLFSIIEIEPIIGDSVIVNISISEGEDVFIKDTYIEGVDSAIIILLKENCYIKMGIGIIRKKWKNQNAIKRNGYLLLDKYYAS